MAPNLNGSAFLPTVANLAKPPESAPVAPRLGYRF